MLEQKDAVILDSLRQNSRKTVKEVAKETGIPRTTVFERVRKMEESGVIKSYSVRPDYAKLDQETLAFIFAGYEPSRQVSQQDVAKEIAKLPGVFEVHIIAGEWDILAKVRGKSVGAIGSMVVDRMRGIPGVSKTLTFPVFFTTKEEC